MDANTIPDETLLQSIAQGNEGAMHTLFNRHSSAIYAFASKRLHEAADAADIVNEVMIQVWKKADTFHGRSQVRTWLLGITNHKVIDLIRKRSRTEHDELDDNIQDDSLDQALLEISQLQDANSIKHCLEGLSDTHRAVIHLAFYEEMSYPEIANTLNCPAGTVKTRVMHAKNNLKRCLHKILNPV